MENIQRTIQFPLQTLEDYNHKNEKFEKIVTDIKKNKSVKEEIDVLLQRNINSSNELEWKNFVKDNELHLNNLKINIEIFNNFIKELKNLAIHQEQISVNL